jgi:uncharacterized lipoprotein
MKTVALMGAIAIVGLSACSDKVTRKTTRYQETSRSMPGTVVAPGAVLDDDETTTSKRTTTRRVVETTD